MLARTPITNEHLKLVLESAVLALLDYWYVRGN